MSLADDQILNNHTYNALDVLGGAINNSRNAVEAMEAVQKFEEKLEKAKGIEDREGKTVIDPEARNAVPLDQAALLNRIKEDMEETR